MTDHEPLTEINFLGSLTVHIQGQRSRVFEYGESLAVTEEVRQGSLDRHGRSWLDLADDDAAQCQRWGQVMFRRGPWPKGVLACQHGSERWEKAYREAKRQAREIEDPVDRAARKREIAATFGPPPMTSRTLRTYPADD